jgi:uroporphyrinogen decarboxylase
VDSHRQPDKRRLLAVFNRELPDRVPNYEVLVDNPTLSTIMGRQIAGGHTLANIDPRDYMEFVTKIGQDVVGMCFYDHPWRCYDADGSAKPLDFRITSRADLDRAFVSSLDHLEERFALLDRYVQAVEGTDIGLFVLLGSFLTDTYTRVFGFENFMYMLYDDRDLIEEVLEAYTDYYVAIARRVATYPLTFFYVGDDLAYKTSTLIHPDLLRAMWVPRMQRIFQPALDRGLPILFHSDGNIEALIPDLLEMGICALNPIEPYGMDIRQIKARYGQDLTLVGNLDVGGALSSGTPDEVRVEAQQLIDDVGRDGGFVLASCHSITSNVLPGNFLAMVDTAQTYGIY